MDGNKDEAVRAKEIAKNKMENNDFEGARKMALKAQSIYPDLESISQLLAVCEVHCSSLKRVTGIDKDWYEILQIERFTDELTVKKQYRKLALFLHPDKNRYPGAEAAFKLICEANAVLSDTTKKSSYDHKIRMSIRGVSVYNPLQDKTLGDKFNPPQRSQSNVVNGFSKPNLQASGSSSSCRLEVFWTACPFCSTRYQYKREVVNASVRCPSCGKGFIAYEISGQYGHQQFDSKPKSRQPVGFKDKRVPSNGVSRSNADTREHDHQNTVKQGQGVDKENRSRYFGESGTSNRETASRKADNLKNNGGKRRRKQAEESSESFDTSVESDIEVASESNINEVHSESKKTRSPRRSSRKRQNVVYHESDDDLARENSVTDIPSSSSAGPKGKQQETNLSEESIQGKVAADKEVKVKRETNAVRDFDGDAVEIKSDSDQDFSDDNSDEDKCDCPDPEFSNFDNGREESRFAVNQIWACYDDTDRMPRFYAKVKRIRKSPFELYFTWFEADRKGEDEKFPVGCGSYKFGTTESTDCLLSFSHQMETEKGSKRGSLLVYPKRGEIWAIFKDCDISLKEKHRFKYEIVEVVSDFISGKGVSVVFLDKITGFVSLFQRSNRSGKSSLLMGPKELYRFSHRVPFFEMSGSEREGVPKGSFELDPASLPLNPDDLYYPAKANIGHENPSSVNDGLHNIPVTCNY